MPRLDVVNREPGDRTIRPLVKALNLVLAPISRRDWRGQEHLPTSGGVIVVSNHISNADALALGQFLSYAGRWPRFLAKSSLFRVPVLGRLLRDAGQIPVERGSSHAVDALAEARTALAAGRVVVVYPEGTITFDPDLWPMRGRTGAARLALASGCPVVPVGQWGAEEFLRGRTVGLPHVWARPTLRMLVGSPVPLDDLRDSAVDTALLHEATARIMAAVTALVAELRGEPAPAEPFDPDPDRKAP
ncbi:MAG: lysophospholipid acyltransferase family protein [Janthinobacterium lividum]